MDSGTVTMGVFLLGVVLITTFTIIGLASRRLRRRLQVPADEMLERDRARWGRNDPDESDDRGEGS